MYHVREWLNKEGIYATSTITAFHGMIAYIDHNDRHVEYMDKKLTIHDCQQSIMLHQVPNQADQDYIDKLRKVASVCYEFADYLESATAQNGAAEAAIK